MIQLSIYFFTNLAAEFPKMFENRAGRVVNGFDTGQSLPYQLQLILEHNGENEHFCGATLVSKKYATTAHHCFSGINEKLKISKNTFYFHYVTVIAGQYEKNYGGSFSIQASSSTGQYWKI